MGGRLMDFESLPMSEVDRVDAACDAFEATWRGGRRPRIEDFLVHAGGAGRVELFRALLALELGLRRGAGEQPEPHEYRGRFPGEVALIEAVFSPVGTGGGGGGLAPPGTHGA